MDKTGIMPKKKRGQQLVNAERNVLISKLIDLMTEGYHSTNSLSKKLRVSRGTIENYKPLANELIAKMNFDRNTVRNLQIKRTYELIEQLIEDLKSIKLDKTNPQTLAVSVKSRALIYSNIHKFNSHLALITGLNIETHVTLDPTKLVIIRAKNPSKGERTVIEQVIEDQPV